MKASLSRGLALAALAGAAAAFLAPAPAGADGEDLSELRELRERGEILSLEEVMQRARKDYPEAHLIEAEVGREEGRLIYEVELIDADGVFRELFFDARTGEPVEGYAEGEEDH